MNIFESLKRFHEDAEEVNPAKKMYELGMDDAVQFVLDNHVGIDGSREVITDNVSVEPIAVEEAPDDVTIKFTFTQRIEFDNPDSADYFDEGELREDELLDDFLKNTESTDNYEGFDIIIDRPYIDDAHIVVEPNDEGGYDELDGYVVLKAEGKIVKHKLHESAEDINDRVKKIAKAFKAGVEGAGFTVDTNDAVGDSIIVSAINTDHGLNMVATFTGNDITLLYGDETETFLEVPEFVEFVANEVIFPVDEETADEFNYCFWRNLD